MYFLEKNFVREREWLKNWLIWELPADSAGVLVTVIQKKVKINAGKIGCLRKVLLSNYIYDKHIYGTEEIWRKRLFK